MAKPHLAVPHSTVIESWNCHGRPGMRVGDKGIRVVIPPGYEKPTPVNTWRVYPKDDKHFVLDFGYRESKDEIRLVSSNLLQAENLRPFLEGVLVAAMSYEQEYGKDLGLGLNKLSKEAEVYDQPQAR